MPDKEKLLRNFLRCANWEEKYLYIIELGQRLPELRDEDKSPQNSIQGCQSQVWIVMRQNAQGIIELQGDSDAAIVKGLIGGRHYSLRSNDAAGYCQFRCAPVV